MGEEPRTESPLDHVRVLDLTDEKGFYCGKVLGDLGADVIKVEPPGGDPARSIGPFYQDMPHPERSLYWWSFNTSKRGITLNIEIPDGQRLLKGLAETADVILESFPPGYMENLGLGYSSLCQINKSIILTSISAFGQTGPYKDYKAPDIVGCCLGGLAFTVGDADRPPCRTSFPQAYLLASIHAAGGTLAALRYQKLSGVGQHVDVSMQEAVTWSLQGVVQYWDLLGHNMVRNGNSRSFYIGPRYPTRVMRYSYPCRDGHVAFMVAGGLLAAISMPAIVGWMAEEGMLGAFEPMKDWGYDEWLVRDVVSMSQKEVDAEDDTLIKFFATRTRSELYEEALKRRIILYPVNTMKDLAEDVQLKERHFYTGVEHPELGVTISYLGAPYRLMETPWRISRRPPLIGEHNTEIYEHELGLSKQKPASTKKNGAIHPCLANSEKNPSARVLEGVKIIDFGWTATGPASAKFMANLGAEVIRIESNTRPDIFRFAPPAKDGELGMNRSAMFALYNDSKYGITLNLRIPQAQKVARRIVHDWANIAIDAMVPGVMERWGLDYESLRRERPDVIHISTTFQGRTGPRSTMPGHGQVGAQLAGFSYVTGWPDREPAMPGNAYTDFIAFPHVVTALIAAVIHRDRTGKGQFIDISQYECSVHFLAPQIMDYVLNGHIMIRMGNRSDYAAPHAIYRCKGEDKWCAIAVTTDEEWTGFCKAIRSPRWTEESRFSSLSGRKANEDELDDQINQWAENYTPEEVMKRMQESGVSAGMASSGQDLVADPQLNYRGTHVILDHPEIGKHIYQPPPYRLSKTPAELTMPAPCIGQHNEYILRDVLGMSDGEIADLVTAGGLE
ncbi:CaiB/BaiF CoA transferase family protein [Chloroflexota bacterium]